MDIAIILTFLLLLLCRHGSCKEIPGKWTCSCASSAPQTNNANCSSSCDCSPEIVADNSRWTCHCAQGFNNCFTSCNCTSSGPSAELKAPKNHISNKIIVYILLLSLVFTTIAFLASLVCYVYRRDKCPMQPPIISSDRYTSCNSATNLINHGPSSLPEFNGDIRSPVNPITGCIQRASFMFRSKRRNIPGALVQFTYFDLDLATNKFSSSNLIGVGGSSHVYRGQLRDGSTIAVKRLKDLGGPAGYSIFITELELIARLHHCHVVRLLGYCSESQGKHAERMLVFEYMSNGNLRDCLDRAEGKEAMKWGTRVSIALGAAKGLEYLHEAAAPRILHRDVKSTNILLDSTWRAKITDLGMAKHLRTDGLPSCSNSPARMQGTFGYFAPEYANVGKASLKSDIFSFGVVLLELITGRQAIHTSPSEGEESLVIWATPRLHDSKRVISELPDPLLKGGFPDEEMQIMTYLAKECLLLDPDSRPSMSEVVQILSTIAPENSRRRNFSPNFFQSSTTSSKETYEKGEEEDEEVESAEDLRRSTSKGWSGRRRWLRNNYPILGKKGGDEEVLSAEYIERLMMLTSKARSSRSSYMDETVDITEPRFETFLHQNNQSL
ncbi:hypothetical protein ACHQM5_020569 [Ranunculus cassubicifolius]